MKTTGEKVSIQGRPFTLGNPLGDGGEGHVFGVVENDKIAIKIINSAKMAPAEIRSVRRHLNRLTDIWSRERNKSTGLNKMVALPMALLDDELGYVMAKASEHESLTNFLHFPEDSEEVDGWLQKYDLSRRYSVIAFLFERLESIHEAGLVFSDLSPNNILISLTKNSVVFIDSDNMRTLDDRFVNVIGTPSYIAPEVFIKDDPKAAAFLTADERDRGKGYLLSTQSDIYSAAVIAFELLTLKHPYKGIRAMGEDTTPEDEEAAERGKFDYIMKPGTDNYCEPNTNIFIDKFDDITTPEIRKLFSRTFIEGKWNPLLRPTAKEFKEAFQKASRLIVRCDHCGEEMIFNLKQERGVPVKAEAICINPACEKRIEPKIVLSIYAVPEKTKSFDDVLFGPESENHYPGAINISNIVLQLGRSQRIYLGDVGVSSTLTAKDRFAELQIKDEETAVIRIEKNAESYLPQLISKKGSGDNKVDPIEIGQIYSFNWNHRNIRFNRIKTNFGLVDILASIRRIS